MPRHASAQGCQRTKQETWKNWQQGAEGFAPPAMQRATAIGRVQNGKTTEQQQPQKKKRNLKTPGQQGQQYGHTLILTLALSADTEQR